jgi:hypothetical protein
VAYCHQTFKKIMPRNLNEIVRSLIWLQHKWFYQYRKSFPYEDSYFSISENDKFTTLFYVWWEEYTRTQGQEGDQIKSLVGRLTAYEIKFWVHWVCWHKGGELSEFVQLKYAQFQFRLANRSGGLIRGCIACLLPHTTGGVLFWA